MFSKKTGLSRVTLWRLLKKKSPVKPEYLQSLLRLLTMEEFEELVSRGEKLRAIGVLKSDGTIDYSLALEMLSLARTDEYLKNAIRFAVENFREDLKRMLGLGFMDVKLTWTDDFEVFLTKLKKAQKGSRPRDYKVL